MNASGWDLAYFPKVAHKRTTWTLGSENQLLLNRATFGVHEITGHS